MTVSNSNEYLEKQRSNWTRKRTTATGAAVRLSSRTTVLLRRLLLFGLPLQVCRRARLRFLFIFRPLGVIDLVGENS
jgi:hypothetical protein